MGIVEGALRFSYLEIFGNSLIQPEGDHGQIGMQQGVGAHGVTVDGVTLDVAAMIASKDAVVRDLTGGIAAVHVGTKG